MATTSKLKLEDLVNEPFYEYVKRNVESNGIDPDNLVIKSSITGHYILKGEEGLVIVEITDTTAFLAPELGEAPVFPKRIQKLTPVEFLHVFGPQLTNDDLFSVKTVGQFYRAIKNLTMEILKEVISAPFNMPKKDQSTWYKKRLDDLKKVKINGGSGQFITKFIHVPSIKEDPINGLDPKLAGTFPDEILN